MQWSGVHSVRVVVGSTRVMGRGPRCVPWWVPVYRVRVGSQWVLQWCYSVVCSGATVGVTVWSTVVPQWVYRVRYSATVGVQGPVQCYSGCYSGVQWCHSGCYSGVQWCHSGVTEVRVGATVGVTEVRVGAIVGLSGWRLRQSRDWCSLRPSLGSQK